VQIGIPFSGSKKLYGDSWGNELKKMLKVNEIIKKKLPAQTRKNKSQNHKAMKKIFVLKDGQTKVQDVKMTEKQISAYVGKVFDCLYNMAEKWDNEGGSRLNDTYIGIYKAMTHAEQVSEAETVNMKFAFTKPEQCAIYMALCCGAFNCLHLHELTNTTPEAVAMLKVLTSREARKRVLEG